VFVVVVVAVACSCGRVMPADGRELGIATQGVGYIMAMRMLEASGSAAASATLLCPQAFYFYSFASNVGSIGIQVHTTICSQCRRLDFAVNC
jgi:hypothetical protein